MKRYIDKTILKFLSGSIINTLATYLLYLILILYFQYRLAYTITYIAGIMLAYLINSTWVFNSRMTLYSALLYPAVYLIQYLASICILSFLVEQFGIDKKIAPLIVIVIVYPLSFIMNRLLFKRSSNHET